MRTVHIEQGQSGTLFIRDGGERLVCAVGDPGQSSSTDLTIRPDEPMAVHMGQHGWLLGHYQREAPMTRDETYRHWFIAPNGTRCGLHAGMRVACGISVQQPHETIAEDTGERLELPPRRGMFSFSEGKPALLITTPERQAIPLADGAWFLIYLGVEWIWGKYRLVETQDPTAHLFYLSEGAVHDDFCSLLPGTSVGLY